jgi:hypothetical protein
MLNERAVRIEMPVVWREPHAGRPPAYLSEP